MTEAEWSACDNVFTMLTAFRARAGARQRRLLPCACCRYLWPLLTDERCRRAVETAERFADGLVTAEELDRAQGATAQAMVSRDPRPESYPSRSARACGLARHHATFAGGTVALPQFPDENLVFHVERAVSGDAEQRVWVPADQAGVEALAAVGKPGGRAARSAAKAARDAAARGVGAARQAAQTAAMAYQRAVLRDLAGPFTPLPVVAAWQTPNAVVLARTMYESRDFTLMPLLADLLEEAGCPQEVSEHCRGPGPHVRGCWVVDLVLRKR